MSKTFDINALSTQLGVAGNRNPVDTAETNSILRDLTLFKNGESTLALTPSGGVHATKSSDFQALEEANPDLARAMPQLGREFRSF